ATVHYITPAHSEGRNGGAPARTKVRAPLAATILVIDDDPFVRQVVADVLTPRGHRVVQASNGREGLDIVANQPADLILVDLVMPIMDGLQMLSRLKATSKTSRIPVIIISAEPDMLSNTQRSQLAALIEKPFYLTYLRS